MTHIQHMTI